MCISTADSASFTLSSLAQDLARGIVQVATLQTQQEFPSSVHSSLSNHPPQRLRLHTPISPPVSSLQLHAGSHQRGTVGPGDPLPLWEQVIPVPRGEKRLRAACPICRSSQRRPCLQTHTGQRPSSWQ